MRTSFFKKELALVHERFNHTFGRQTVCNVRTRYRVILCIVGLGILCDKITRADNKDLVRNEIKRFCRTRNKLMTLFAQAEKLWKERSRNEKAIQRAELHGLR